MNELYFSVKDSKWKAEKPTAYYMDDICEFLVSSKEFENKESFVQDFIKPLMTICREKYNSITNGEAAGCEEDFIMEIPHKISREAKPAFLWYMEEYPDGEFFQLAKDFLSAANKAELIGSAIVIEE